MSGSRGTREMSLVTEKRKLIFWDFVGAVLRYRLISVAEQLVTGVLPPKFRQQTKARFGRTPDRLGIMSKKMVAHSHAYSSER